MPVRRNLAQLITTRLLRTAGTELARVLGKDESVASRVKSGERAVNVVEFLQVIDLIGYKVVSKHKVCVEADELNMLRRHYMHTHGGLAEDWDEPE